MAKLSAGGRGVGPWQTRCLDLQTGEEFTVCSTDGEWEARRLTVSDLPPALLAAWPRDDRCRAEAARQHDRPRAQTVGPEQLRRLAASVDSAPAQGSLFG